MQYLNMPRRASSCVSRRSKLGDLVFSQALHTFEQNVLKTTGSTVQELLAAPAKVLRKKKGKKKRTGAASSARKGTQKKKRTGSTVLQAAPYRSC
jgi:hypothetical protein